MKPKLSLGLSILICLILVVFGVVYGTVSGYADERAHVTDLLSGDNGIAAILGYRAADALNLCVVAERHIPGDATVVALRNAAEDLRGAKPTISALQEGDGALAAAFTATAAALKASPSFAQSARDAQYLGMLTADFDQYGSGHVIYQTYNKAVAAFDQKLSTPVLGDLARLFGVTPCQPY